MQSKKFRWSQVYESSEEELLDFLNSRNIKSSRVHLDEGETLSNEQFDNASTLWCAEGSLLLSIDSKDISLQPGDALKIEANVTCSIQAGIAGCAYYISA